MYTIVFLALLGGSMLGLLVGWFWFSSGKKISASLQAQIDSALVQIDRLIQELSSSQEAVQRLATTKNDLLSAQQKVQYYTAEISALNKKYIDLKRAYDALDIEYAQLYEKQS